ncbi:MAG: carboxypeptidase-like regulatory domain-containing protein [bacterium]
MSNHTFHVIEGFVDIIGNNKKPQLYGFVDIVNLTQATPNIKLNGDFIEPISGLIEDNGNPVSNVKITFIDQNMIIKDYCITSDDEINKGKYYIYVEPGIYTVKIGNEEFPNTKIEKGLINEYYYTIDGYIKERINDTVTFFNTPKRLITGKLLDEDNEPILEGEIIVTNANDNSLLTYVKTNENGEYKFALENGIYDIRIRGKRKSIKIIKGVEFLENKGFIESIKDQDPLFYNDGWILYGGEN